MSWSSRRAVLVLTLVAMLAGVSAVTHLHAQGKGKRPPKGGGPGDPKGPPVKNVHRDLGNLQLTKNDETKEQLDFVEDCVKSKDWERACETLQRLVGRGTVA